VGCCQHDSASRICSWKLRDAVELDHATGCL
jgi:hypothetical protein